MILPESVERLIDSTHRLHVNLVKLRSKDLPSEAFNGGGISCAMAGPEYDWWWEQEYPDPQERAEVRCAIFREALQCEGFVCDPSSGG